MPNVRRSFWRILCEYCVHGIDKALLVESVEAKNKILFQTKTAVEEMIQDFKSLIDLDKEG